MSPILLIVEDDIDLANGLITFLQSQGYACKFCNYLDKVGGLWKKADLVILDRQFYDIDTINLLPDWLAIKAIPVLILTAKVDINERVAGLDAGARDYITKPFSYNELLARIRANLRPFNQLEWCYQSLKLLPTQRKAFWNDIPLVLTKTEFDLLALFVRAPGRVYTRDELLNEVWGYQYYPTTRTVDTHILQLRKKIPEITIESVRGVGYRLCM
ncbi:response regulator transcription factor [Zooshikella harenae]|uniref:Response regulator transcription factor n=1 Tax=Zooshikella harenae TaxID=2827238 RepID=A0ABS5ZFY8_9GAMM|nr:response regulator transcription factor [Zooshikella harenae]MBU2712984.1 response regulator transcription factor [Zooshikella harenae]